MPSNFINWFIGDSKTRELDETFALCREAEQNLPASPFYDDDTSFKFVYALVVEICEQRHSQPTTSLGEA